MTRAYQIIVHFAICGVIVGLLARAGARARNKPCLHIRNREKCQLDTPELARNEGKMKPEESDFSSCLSTAGITR